MKMANRWMKVIIMFVPENICSGEMGHFGPENGTSHNSGSALRIFLKYCIIKGANRYMEILLVVFQEKIHLGQFDLFSF